MAQSLAAQIHSLTTPPADSALTAQIKSRLDSHFPDVDSLLQSHVDASHGGSRRRKKLSEEIVSWESRQARVKNELSETATALPPLLEQAQESLQTVLSSAQDISLKRYALADKLAELVSDVSATNNDDDDAQKSTRGTALVRLEAGQQELRQLEAGLSWVKMLQRVVSLSEAILSPANHKTSPLDVLPQYRQLHDTVDSMQKCLPKDMGLLSVVEGIKDRTWEGLKDIMNQNLTTACDGIGWPKKVIYDELSISSRRAFEYAYRDLLCLQAEKEYLEGETRPPHWSSGKGLYPLQAMVRPIELKFKYHFMGTKGTNRVDKPEWAFANILDQMYTHHSFLTTYLQPLTASSDYSISITSEFAMMLFPILLTLLRARIPHLLDRPALLAHTMYQTVVFDEAVTSQDFSLANTSLYEGRQAPEWEGLAGVILREEGWYERWLAGEKKFADGRLDEIISSPDAWAISDELVDGEEGLSNLRPTVSARQVKALVEQIIDRYAPLPDLVHKLPFLLTIQLPILSNYLARITSSLDAFENISLAFVRAVPGALAGNTRSGVSVDHRGLTSGKLGVERLVKAYLSAGWIGDGLRDWADGMFFSEMSHDFRNSSTLKWRVQSNPLIPQSILYSSSEEDASVFDVLIEQGNSVCKRAEDMIVKLVTAEVENDLRQHLTRQWDQPPSPETAEPSPQLLSALTTYTSHLSTLLSLLPPLVVSRIYRGIANDLSRHILQRGVYAGWSKFSERGGNEFKAEVQEWREATKHVFTGTTASENWKLPYDAPWSRLVQIAQLLSLPTSATHMQGTQGGSPTFAQAMAVAWSDGPGLDDFERSLDIDFSREELQGVLRRRVECWK